MKHSGRRGGLVLAVLAGVLLAGCGSDSSSTTTDTLTPEEVVSGYYAALAAKDAEGACDLVSAATAEQTAAGEDVDTCVEGAEAGFAGVDSGELATVAGDPEIGEVTIDGDTATVAVTAAGDTGDVPLVKEDGEWKVTPGE